MALTEGEIAVGIVAYLDPTVFDGRTDVTLPTSPTPRPGPFVCFQAAGGRSAWSAISTVHRDERLLIDSTWRYDGSVKWRTSDQYLNDGSTTYIGDNGAFVAAAAAQDNFGAAGRPKVTAAGVAAVLAEVRSRGGNTL